METKTIEYMEAAVLAECERLCPNDEGTFAVVINGLPCTITGRHHHGIADFDIRETGPFERRIYQIRSSDDGNWWHLYYIFLGLAERDAVAAEKARLLKRYKTRIKRLRADDAETHRIQIEVKDERIAELQARNTALVAALDQIKKQYGLEHGVLRGERPVINSLGEFINEVLEANTEKGGVQG